MGVKSGGMSGDIWFSKSLLIKTIRNGPVQMPLFRDRRAGTLLHFFMPGLAD